MKNNTAIGVVAGVVIVGGLGLWVMSMNSPAASPSPSVTPTQSTQAQVPQTTKNIVELASGDPQFSTLVTAVKAAGLVETLSAAGPYTVFAPTNEAFAKLPAGTLDSLLADPAKLKAVLTYHVVSGDVKSADVVKLTSATTVNGKAVPIVVDGSTVKVGAATVTTTDLAATNGTVHVIDTVLVP